MPQHCQLLKLRLNRGPPTTANANYAKYLLELLVLLKFFRVSNEIRFIFLKNLGETLRENIEHLELIETKKIIYLQRR